jgi:glc operon protein GlcG
MIHFSRRPSHGRRQSLSLVAAVAAVRVASAIPQTHCAVAQQSVIQHDATSREGTAWLGRRREPHRTNGKHSMTKLGIGVGVLTMVFSLSAQAQTIEIMTLGQAGAEKVLQAAKQSAEQRNAPSAIAVVDPAGDLLAFQRMDHVRPASADLAIEKARTAARLQRPTEEVEDNINRGRTAFVTAGIAALRGGVPVRVNGQVVGAVGVAGRSKETDTEIANTAAAAPTAQR